MSVHVTSWVLKHSEESVAGRRLVLLVLADKADEDGSKAFPSVATIARESRMSERGVRYALRELQKAGRIKAGDDPHPMYRTTEYTVVMSENSAVADPGNHCPPAKPSGGKTEPAGGQNATGADVADCPLTTLTASIQNQKEEDAPASAKKVTLPDGFPDELRPHLKATYRVLRDLAERHAAKEVNVCALAQIVMANHRKPLVSAVHDCAAHWEGKQPKNTVACFRNWLRGVDALAVIEPLDDDGFPAVAAPQRSGNVHPIRQSNGKPTTGQLLRELDAANPRLNGSNHALLSEGARTHV